MHTETPETAVKTPEPELLPDTPQKEEYNKDTVMPMSRINRNEEKRQRNRLVIAVGGSIGLLVFLLLFAGKLLVGFSLLIDRSRGATPQQAQNQTIILPPVLDPLPEATNSATLTLSGRGQKGLTLVVYLNEKEAKKMTIPENGTFTIPSLTGQSGSNTISAKLIDDHGGTSDLSNVITTTIKNKAPLMEVTNPEDRATITSDTNVLAVSGRTEEGNTVALNDRFVVVRNDGTFTYQLTLSDGENKFTVIATDEAGNTTKVERTITYQKP